MPVQPEFQPLVTEALDASVAQFGARLAAFYLHGSIAQGDAVPFVSDLDAMLILEDDVTDADVQWQQDTQEALHERYPQAAEVHLTLLSRAALAQNGFARFALMYNAQLLRGRHIAEEMGAPLPDAWMAKSRLAFAEQCFADALAGKQPACTGPLPDDPQYRARKFARYFVVIEGAYFLMTRGRFTSFAADDVLPELENAAPQFAQEIALTRNVLADAKSAGIDGGDYLYTIQMFIKWIFETIRSY